MEDYPCKPNGKQISKVEGPNIITEDKRRSLAHRTITSL